VGESILVVAEVDGKCDEPRSFAPHLLVNT